MLNVGELYPIGKQDQIAMSHFKTYLEENMQKERLSQMMRLCKVTLIYSFVMRRT